jgi:outer membrane protein assembly factor BamB
MRFPYKGTIVVLSSIIAGCGGKGALPPPSGSSGFGSPSNVDWSTFGDGIAREGFNPNESALTASNASGLRLIWSRDLGRAIDAQPIYAAGVKIGSSTHDVLYVGTEGGLFDAIDAQSGAVLWSKTLGSTTSTCQDLPGGVFGITDTAVFDRTTDRVYVADGQDEVHALAMDTGQEAAGWPVAATPYVSQEHVYAALTYNPSNQLLYVETASYCDTTPYQGRIVAIDTNDASIAATFLPSQSLNGGGLWGMGGASIDASTGDVFIATGNTESTTEHDAYGEQVMRLTADLAVEATNYPGLSSGIDDYDFGSTPMLYQFSSCPPELTAQNKDGVLYIYGQSTIASGPVQSLEMSVPGGGGHFIGVAAYSPQNGLVYIGDPSGYGSYTNGLVALKVQSDCSLALAWQKAEGPNNDDDDNIGATVAGDVVYSADGLGDAIFANDAATGRPLWNSGTTIGGAVMAPPAVTAGHVFVGSWDHKLYAFGI